MFPGIQEQELVLKSRVQKKRAEREARECAQPQTVLSSLLEFYSRGRAESDKI